MNQGKEQKSLNPKEAFMGDDDDKILRSMEFSVGGNTFNRQLSVGEVVDFDMYEPNTTVIRPNGPLDSKFGPNMSGEDILCATCNKPAVGCPGHFGHLSLSNRLFHHGYFDETVFVLQMICKSCSRVLIAPENRDLISTKLASGDIAKAGLKIEARKCKVCPYCKAVNGKVKKSGYLKISHELLGQKDHKKYSFPQIEEFHERAKATVIMDDYYQTKSVEHFIDDILPEKAYQLLKQIKTEDLKFILFDRSGRPENLIVSSVIVPPNTIRPSAPSMTGKGTTEDDITVKLSELAWIESKVHGDAEAKQKANPSKIHDVAYKSNAVHATLINGAPSGVPFQVKQKNTSRGVVQRLKGKQGRFRQNLSGKRVNYTGRTVISPDPHLGIDEVGVPVHMAVILTYPEVVTSKNRKFLSKLVERGNEWPGAKQVKTFDDVEKKWKTFTLNENKQIREWVAREKLHIGATVYRHMIDKDIVLFNRQPSLHRISIMAHHARVGPDHRTLRFNECVCNPYNADFDGDEMNIHFPQTEEARAEAKVLLGTKNNICTPKDGSPIISAIQDFITSSYLLTKNNKFFNWTQASKMMSAMTDCGKNEQVELFDPAILKPEACWTGKQIFSMVLRPNHHCSNVKIFLETVTKTNNQKKMKLVAPEYCPQEGYVIIHNSELLAGRMDKVTLGAGSKNNIFYTLKVDYGPQYAADAMKRLAKLSCEYLSDYGFSIGVGDVTPNAEVVREKNEKLDEGIDKCTKLTEEFKNNKLTALPGCTAEETLELKMLGVLSKVRNDAGDSCKNLMPVNCAPKIMAMCNSKGSFVNLSQMAATVGQQAIGGKRVPLCFDQRSLLFFEEKCKSPEAGGFVRNSFHSGLRAYEYFFHTQAGREGLVDTAVKTADTGYMQRRLVKCLEDMSVKWDGTVRAADNQVVQFEYGGDGFDPLYMEGKGEPVDFGRVLKMVKVSLPFNNCKALSSVEIGEQSKSALKKQDVVGNKDKLYSELEGYIQKEMVEKVVSFEASNDIADVPQQHECRITATQLETFISKVCAKLKNALIEPGTAVGAICAQSVGEPGTQMTLKTFHFAGVASMNITQGVPRIKEIINASPKIATPVILCELEDRFDKYKAAIVQQRLERTKLKEIHNGLSFRLFRNEAVVFIQLDTETMKGLNIQLNAHTIKESIKRHKVLKEMLQNAKVEVRASNLISIAIKGASKKFTFDQIFKGLRCGLEEVQVSGLAGVTRAVVDKKQKKGDDGKEEYQLVVEGTGLLDVMTTRGVKSTQTISNNIMEVRRVYKK